MDQRCQDVGVFVAPLCDELVDVDASLEITSVSACFESLSDGHTVEHSIRILLSTRVEQVQSLAKLFLVVEDFHLTAKIRNGSSGNETLGNHYQRSAPIVCASVQHRL